MMDMGIEISIHALREEGDGAHGARSGGSTYFYPRPPRGGRPTDRPEDTAAWIISIHALREEGDPRPSKTQGLRSISIHALREEGDGGGQLSDIPVGISIHALREEGDIRCRIRNQKNVHFYPRPPRGGRPCGYYHSKQQNYQFLSTPSARRATAKTERKPSAFVSLYTSLHKLQRDACKTNRKITPLLAQTAGVPVRSVPENHVCCRFALAGHQKISTLSWANSGCSPTCSTFV